MPIFALLAGIALVAGIGTQIAGTVTQAQGAKKQADESVKIEKLREEQMKLESERQRREIVRQELSARSKSLINAQLLGVSQSSSGVQGGLDQIRGQSAENTLGVNQAENISSGIFKGNAGIAQAGGMVAFGQGLSSLGQSISGIRFG